ncbi:MAG: hypothetical protein WC791_01420 [Candidatus Paceibacterota bacterium]|jgi:hypothetical protein
MAIPFLANKKQEQALTLLIDVGSSSVGAALVKMGKGSVPQVLASVREDISFQEVLSSSRFLFAMNRSLDTALKNIQSKGLVRGKLSNVFCTLSSPWFILKTRNMQISRLQEFEVNEHTLEEFIDEDVTLLKEELKQTLPPRDVRVIEKKIIQMKLNGYEIKNPYKQRTTRMEMSTTVCISSNKVIQGIERKIHKYFHIAPIHFGAFPVAAFSVVRDMFPVDKNFLFLDITGESTDISRIENDILTGTLSFPYGRNFIIREISMRMRTVHEEAASLFAMFLRNELDDARRAPISEIIEWAKKEWLIRFEKTVAALSAGGTTPNKIYFTIDSDIEPLFSSTIRSAKSELLVNGGFDVQYLDQLIVSKFVVSDPGITRDPFIVTEVLFAQKMTEQFEK